jgi:hypothetical protein
MLTGIVTGQEIRKNRDSEINVRMLQVQISNPQDIQSVEYVPLAGDDNPPQNGDTVFILSFGQSYKCAIGVRDAIVASMSAGERKLYSRDSNGDIAAFINLLAGGNVELNGNAFSAVRFAELQTAFDALKSVVNTHTHLYNPGPGSPIATAAGTPQSTADITPAESDTVKLL